MKTAWIRFVCRWVIASMMLTCFATARAGMIGPDQAASGDRAAVMSALDRSDVSNALRANGVDPQAARERVLAMTDDEVSGLKGRIDAVPAGGAYGGGGGGGAGVAIAVVIIIAIIIWYNWK